MRAAMELVPELDEHLAALSVLLHQYLKHLWLARGLGPGSVIPVMYACHGGVMIHMSNLVERTLALGGVPLCSPTEQMNVSYLEHEEEGVYHPYEMVQHDLAHEVLMTERLLISIETAQDLEDSGTEAVLKRVLNGSQERAVNLTKLLGDLLGVQDGLTA